MQARSGDPFIVASPDRGMVRTPHRVRLAALAECELLAALVLLLADRARRAEVVERRDLVGRRALLVAGTEPGRNRSRSRGGRRRRLGLCRLGERLAPERDDAERE